jgi:hypothetical protein
MLAQVFNPTEIKKNGPATRPASAPARRVAFLFDAGWLVLADTAPKLLRGTCIVNRYQSNLWSRREMRRGSARRVNPGYSDWHLIRVA